MHRRFFVPLLLYLLLLASCVASQPLPTSTPEPSAATPSTSTAVFTSTPSPTLTSTPLPTETPPPTATPPPPTAVPSLDDFVGTLNANLENKWEETTKAAIRELLTGSLRVGFYDFGVTPATAPDVAHLFTYPFGLNVQPFAVQPVDEASLREDLLPTTLFPELADQIKVVEATGFSSSGAGRGLLYLVAENGRFLLTGLILTPDSFTREPLATAAPPVGLLYELELPDNQYQYWLVDETQTPELFFSSEQRVNFSPDGTLAVSIVEGSSELTFHNLTDQSSSQIPLDGTLMTTVERLRWFDAETITLSLTQDVQPVQGSEGQLTLLNLRTQTTTQLPRTFSIYFQPYLSPNGVISFDDQVENDLFLWTDGQETAVSVNSDLNNLYQTVPSPDGQWLVGIDSTGSEPQTLGYFSIDLNQQTQTLLHAYVPVPTDAINDYTVNWSPNSQWLALTPWTPESLETGVRLATPSGDQSLNLGMFSHSPLWRNDQQLLFTGYAEGKFGLQQFDLTTQTAVWLALPQFPTQYRQALFISTYDKPMIRPLQFIPTAP